MADPLVETLREEIDRLRVEVAESRTSRERLVLSVDAERSRIERDLHEGVQQRLVALAVSVQLAGPLLDDHPAAGKLLEELLRDVLQALEESAALAERIYPALLDAGGLAAALRSAAARAGTPASVQVARGSSCPPHHARTVYWCWLDVLEHAAAGGGRAAITVRLENEKLVFDVVEEGSSAAAEELDARLEAIRGRVGALGGELTVSSDTGAATRVHGSLPPSLRRQSLSAR